MNGLTKTPELLHWYVKLKKNAVRNTNYTRTKAIKIGKIKIDQ